MARKKHIYVVGFDRDCQCVYGKDGANGESCYVDPVTLSQAERKVKTLFKSRIKRMIYKLVPVKGI